MFRLVAFIFGTPVLTSLLESWPSGEFDALIAERMRAAHRTLATRWFDKLCELLPVDAREIFPTDRLLDRIPVLIEEISAYLKEPEESAIAANTAMLEKARELGALRHSQRASLHQVLREYQLLAEVLVAFVLDEIEQLRVAPRADESVLLVSRLHLAVYVLSQSTVEAFVTLYTEKIAEQRERLEQFTRMAAHEWRQPLDARQFGVSLLRRPHSDPPQVERTWASVERNVQRLLGLTYKLEAVARMQSRGDTPLIQQASVTMVAQEAVRHLREMADARGVEIRVSEDLPTLTVDVGRLEVVLLNLLSNAIEYSDPAKAKRYVNVLGSTDGDGWCRVEVSDNGVGIPPHARNEILPRFTRAHPGELTHVDGVGLGLSIVDDCVRRWADASTSSPSSMKERRWP